MATRPRGNRSYVDWLMESCDTSPCDLSPETLPEKYGRPVKSAIKLPLSPDVSCNIFLIDSSV